MRRMPSWLVNISLTHPRRDGDDSAGLLELFRRQDVVGVADTPELRRIAGVTGRDPIEPLPLRDDVLDESGGAPGGRDDAPPQVPDLARAAVRIGDHELGG